MAVTVDTVRKRLETAFKAETRETLLNSKLHFVPLNLAALNVTLQHVLRTSEKDVEDDVGYGQYATIAEIRRGIVEFAESRHKNKLYLDNLPEDFAVDPKKYTPAVVYRSKSGDSINNVAGLLYPSYDSTYAGIFKSYIRTALTPYLKDKPYEEANAKFKGKGFEKGFDVGHVFAQDIATTPVFASFDALTDQLSKEITQDPTKRGWQELTEKIIRQKNLLKRNSKYGIRVSGTFTKEVKDFLVGIEANVVVIQDRLENQYEYGNQIEAVVKRAVLDVLQKVTFSPSIEDEIVAKISDTILGKKPRKTKVSKKMQPIKIADKVTSNIAVTTTQSEGSQRVLNEKIKPPVSDVSLEVILRAKIAEQVKKNMGNGNATRVLNNRTGRFANSITIERLSESRAGMITVFYNYMKNPYATFSAGGRQQFPDSRDPKLLIAKSIREIGTQLMINRMRAVLA